MNSFTIAHYRCFIIVNHFIQSKFQYSNINLAILETSLNAKSVNYPSNSSEWARVPSTTFTLSFTIISSISFAISYSSSNLSRNSFQILFKCTITNFCSRHKLPPFYLANTNTTCPCWNSWNNNVLLIL